MPLRRIFHVDRVRLALTAHDKGEVLSQMADLLCVDSPLPPEAVCTVLRQREEIASTAVGSGVAIPHGRLAQAETVRGALGLLAEGIDFDAVDGQPVRIVVGLLAPEDRPVDHLKALARVSRRLRRPEVRRALLAAHSAQEALEALLRDPEAPEPGAS